MTTEPSVDDVIALVKEWHDGQTDWCGEPYWMHPVAVMRLLPLNASKRAQVIALCHDVLEDCKQVDEDVLRNHGFKEAWIEGIRRLTHHKNDPRTYKDYISDLIAHNDYDVVLVKLADNTHNSCPLRSAKLSPEGKIRSENMIKKRYSPTREVLLQALQKFTR